jgi:hypothetical protein
VREQAEAMVKAAESAVERAHRATETFRAQAEVLKESSDLAASQIGVIEEKKAESRRDAFLRSATYIVDKLNSLAIDLNRVLDADIPKSTWRAFYDGDKGAFTRRLLGSPAIKEFAAIKRKFEADTDFRTYVARYLNEYEALIEQTKKWDYDNLVASAFVNADIGKLYGVLCKALDRPLKS